MVKRSTMFVFACCHVHITHARALLLSTATFFVFHDAKRGHFLVLTLERKSPLCWDFRVRGDITFWSQVHQILDKAVGFDESMMCIVGIHD